MWNGIGGEEWDPCVEPHDEAHIDFGAHNLRPIDEKFHKLDGTWEAKRGPVYNDIGAGPKDMPPNYKHMKSVELFSLLFPTDLMEIIVMQTNLYIRQEHTGEPIRKLPQLVTVKELYVWMGLHIKMMRNWCFDQDAYWKDRGPFNARVYISYRRFYFIKRHLHFRDTTREPAKGTPGYDPLYKVRTVVDILCATFQKYWKMGRYGSLDEMMVLFGGKNPLHRFVRGKPHPNGFKLHAICDALSYFCCSFLVDDNEKRTISDIARKLFPGVVHPGMTIVTDRFYTCKGLVQFCLHHGVGLIGTTTGNRFMAKGELPGWSGAEAKRRARGEFECAVNEDKTVCCICWKDKGVVRLTCTTSNTCSTLLTRSRRGKGRFQVYAPTAASIANKYFHGVDRNDQLRGRGYGLCLTFKAQKYTVKLFFGLLDIVLSNTWILWRTIHKKDRKSHAAWVNRLAEELLAFNPFNDPAYADSIPVTPLSDTASGKHRVRRLARMCSASSSETSSSTGGRPDRRVAECPLCRSVHRKRKRVCTGCAECGVALCAKPVGSTGMSCHTKWHAMTRADRDRCKRRKRKLVWDVEDADTDAADDEASL